ncbi:Com family DNA-binding transcriptional regulator [Pseudomonas fluorescens]|uniref:Com family DNA-binding transcriptional regulator n=1 Tax=Pseudomonas fluorescens TaxID=294 RepID=UPI00259B2713|nr:Com family DNA-binding transcriptional regulator [Pseudomonas fluorescens]WJK10265.1 Com family DNA-binding transcriptional regulator [Pseudomonas fluorescens]
MEDIRCGNCARKLAVGLYIELNIKCPRCGTLNSLRATSPAQERPRASTERQDLCTRQLPSSRGSVANGASPTG